MKYVNFAAGKKGSMKLCPASKARPKAFFTTGSQGKSRIYSQLQQSMSAQHELQQYLRSELEKGLNMR